MDLDKSGYMRRKKQLEENNFAVRRPIGRINSSIIKSNRGTKKKYTPTRMKNSINKYFEWCETNDEVPSIKGLMIHLDMYKDMFYVYLKYEGFSDIMEHARMMIANWAEIDVYNTKGMAAGKISYMKNVHGWSDKLETNNFTEVRQLTPEMARAKIEMLAPKLLEALKNSEVLRQIVHRDEVEEAQIVKRI